MNPCDGPWFDHERLEVYRESIAFVAWLSPLLEGAVRIGEVKDQLDRAASSAPLNIAEGNGKYAPKDRCRYFDTAHGSALECAAGLDVLVAKAKLTPDQIRAGKERLQKSPALDRNLDLSLLPIPLLHHGRNLQVLPL